MPHANVRGDNYNKLITRTTLKTRVEICIQWYSRFCWLFVTNQAKFNSKFSLYEPISYKALKRRYALTPLDGVLRVIRFKQNNVSFITAQQSWKLVVGSIVRNHLNIKSLGNYSGIHPSLITPEGGMRETM